jgi:multiple sugar transport system substrate-binding protein
MWALALAGAALTAGAAACGGSAAPAHSGPVTVTFWTWVPHLGKEVALFEKTHPGIKVNVVDPGQGAVAYQKLQTAIKAGKGAPDAAQIEYQMLPTFEVTHGLVNLAKYGAGKLRSAFVPSAWDQVVSQGGIWGIPQDTGPMGVLYRKDIFQRYKLSVPTTWAQFAADAAKLHRANPGITMTDLAPNDPGQLNGLFWQAGSRPFRMQGGTSIAVSVNDPGATRAAAYWQKLDQQGQISTDPDFTPQWYSSMAKGRYATWITAAWGPLFLSGAAKSSAGEWRAAPLPQWTAGQDVSADWGGSTTAVTTQSKHPQQAAEFAMWLNSNPQAVRMLAAPPLFLFPSLKSALGTASFHNSAPSFYGGQHVNALFSQIAQTVPAGFEWSPFQAYVYSQYTSTIGKAMTGKGSWVGALAAAQQSITGYAKSQGLTVTGG